MTNRYGIIGDGTVGVSIAYHLNQETDEEVILFEREVPASEPTYKSVAQYGFYGDETQYKMKRYGMKIYNQLFSDSIASPRYTSTGHLTIATTDKNAALMQQSIENDGDEQLGKFGIGFDRDLVEYLDGDTIKETLLLPLVDEELIEGALFRPKVGYINRPHELAYEFLMRAEKSVRVRTNTEVTAVETASGRVSGAKTDTDSCIELDEVICAAGPWNVHLAESVNLEIPVRHTLALVLKLQLDEVPDCDLPVINHFKSSHAFHRRSREEFLLGYNPGDIYEEAEVYDPEAMSETVPKDVKLGGFVPLKPLIPELGEATSVDEWIGIRSITPDRNPVIGWTDLKGFSIAAFHTSGIQLAPYVGKMITEQILYDEPGPLYYDLSITRFDGYTDYRN